MKSTTKIAIVAAMGLLVASMAPVAARCVAAGNLQTNGAYIVSNPNWGGADWTGGNGTCVYAGCYPEESAAPISADIKGVFWAWVPGAGEGGDPVYLLGNDNGSWGAVNFTALDTVYDGTGATFYYPAFFSANDQDPALGGYVPGTTPAWTSSTDIDGCPTNVTPTISGDECTCLLFTDQWDSDGDGVEEGYFALLSDKTDAANNFDFRPWLTPNPDPTNHPSPIIKFAPIPDASILMAEAQGDTGDVLLQIGAPGIPAAGDYRDPECPCDMAFQVLAQTLGRGGPPPAGRRACTPQDYQNSPDYPATPVADICQGLGLQWIPAADPAGADQPTTPVDQGTMVRVDCDPTVATDLYLGTQLTGPVPGGSGMGGQFGSANSTRIFCGDNSNVVTDPTRPDRNEGRSDDAPRGRDENRGRGNANGRR
jgi:hypothetical protein